MGSVFLDAQSRREAERRTVVAKLRIGWCTLARKKHALRQRHDLGSTALPEANRVKRAQFGARALHRRGPRPQRLSGVVSMLRLSRIRMIRVVTIQRLGGPANAILTASQDRQRDVLETSVLIGFDFESRPHKPHESLQTLRCREGLFNLAPRVPFGWRRSTQCALRSFASFRCPRRQLDNCPPKL
jgi:hypothetical protein